MMPLQGDMLHRGCKHSVMKFKMKRVSWMPFKTFLGVENNQELIRIYELTDTDTERVIRLPLDERGQFIEMFTLREYFIHLFEESVDTVTWLRIKQLGTHTINFDLISFSPLSFSFELHTKDEIIRFSEHNPNHDIILGTGENCVLVYKTTPGIRAGSKIYVYYNL